MQNSNLPPIRGIQRRELLKGTAGLGALALLSGGSLLSSSRPVSAQDAELRKAIVQIPGVGKGSPTSADRQKVSEMCLGLTKANVKPGEFAGVELNFLGVTEGDVHNGLFRDLLKPWEEYTGAKINWIDFSNADFNPHLTESIAARNIDFDLLEMGAPREGDLCGNGLASEMPDWVKQQIDLDDYTNLLKAPVGTWGGKTYRVSVDGDCHNFNYRTDVFSDADLAKAWKSEGNGADWGVPKTWQQVNAATKFLKGKELNGQPLYGYLDACKGWGGFGFYFTASRASAYVKHPDDPAWLFDADTMKPRINNPGWVRAIQDIVDSVPFESPVQLNADPGTTGYQQFLAGTGSMVAWWGDVGSQAKTSDGSVVGDVVSFGLLPGSDDVYNSKTGNWDKLASGPNVAPNCAYMGWGVYVTSRVDSDSLRHKAAWSAAAHLGDKNLSLWTVMYPSGFQVYRNSHGNVDEWVGAGYDRDYISAYIGSQIDSYNHPNRMIEPRIPGIFQYYSIAEDEMAKIFAKTVPVQQGADNIAAAWEKLTDQIGRESQLKLYRGSLGL